MHLHALTLEGGMVVQYLEAAGAGDEYETDGDDDETALTATEHARASLARRSVQARIGFLLGFRRAVRAAPADRCLGSSGVC